MKAILKLAILCIFLYASAHALPTNSDTSLELTTIKQPRIELLEIRAGWLVDSIRGNFSDGTATDNVGGMGGNYAKYSLDNIIRIDVKHVFVDKAPTVGQIVLHSSNGAMQEIGKAWGGPYIDTVTYDLREKFIADMKAVTRYTWGGLVGSVDFILADVNPAPKPPEDNEDNNDSNDNDNDNGNDEGNNKDNNNSDFDFPFAPVFKAFQFTIETTSVSHYFTIGAYGNEYLYDVDCNSDGVLEGIHVTTAFSCDYDTVGTHKISIFGDYPQFIMPEPSAGQPSFATMIRTIDQWGSIKWKTFNSFFAHASYLTDIQAVDAPNLTKVTALEGLFFNVLSLQSANIGHWDVSTITSMKHAFRYSNVNADISGWDVSNVVDMSYMFWENAAFNQDISKWNVGSVTDMRYMFRQASSFKQDLANWNVQNVTDMSFMFYKASAFNSDLSKWSVSNVRNMDLMFGGASNFSNNNLLSWDIRKVGNNRLFDWGWGKDNIAPDWSKRK